MQTEIRKATEADVPRLSEAFAAAFQDDPLMGWIYRDGERRRRLLPKAFTFFLSRWFLRHGETYMHADGVGGAVWCPPGTWRITNAEMVRGTPAMLWKTGGYGFARGARIFNTIEKEHPHDPPHWYLAILGTEPGSQSKGVGSTMLSPVLERCDTEGLPAYLESSNPRNVPFYARHGFVTTKELEPAKGAWVGCMWRDPR